MTDRSLPTYIFLHKYFLRSAYRKQLHVVQRQQHHPQGCNAVWECLPTSWRAVAEGAIGEAPLEPSLSAITLLLADTAWASCQTTNPSTPTHPPSQHLHQLIESHLLQQPEHPQPNQHPISQVIENHKACGHIRLTARTLNVATLTSIQLKEVRAARQNAWLACAVSAINLAEKVLPAPDPTPAATLLLHQLPHRVQQVWKLPWENKWKEVWWRLLQHGVFGAGGHGVTWAKGKGCSCGWEQAVGATTTVRSGYLREHVFWGCACAKVVRSILQHNLPPEVTLQPLHLWLLVPPSNVVQADVWYTVCLAALTVLSKGPSLLERGGIQLVLDRVPGLLKAALVDFAQAQGNSAKFQSLSPRHPFVSWDPSACLVCSLSCPSRDQLEAVVHV